MRWPWSGAHTGDLLIVSWFEQSLAYVRARHAGDGRFDITGFGVEHQGIDDSGDVVQRLEALGLKGRQPLVMLRPAQYQWLQIEAPGVAPEELRSAARYQIRDLIDVHVDDITLDVMRAGDGQGKRADHLFVVAAPSKTLRSAMELGESLRWDVSVIDVQETAQRNLQTAIAIRDGHARRATAALVLADASLAVLTICADGELLYTRRLELPTGFLKGGWRGAELETAPTPDAYTPVEEYVPDHGATLAGYNPVGEPGVAGSTLFPTVSTDDDGARRFLVEVQRSLDVWDRSWSTMPLASVSVYAGSHSAEIAQWLTRELGQPVMAMDVAEFFSGFNNGSEADRMACWPLLGVLMRTETRKL